MSHRRRLTADPGYVRRANERLAFGHELSSRIDLLVDQLDDLQRAVLVLRYGLGVRFEEGSYRSQLADDLTARLELSVDTVASVLDIVNQKMRALGLGAETPVYELAGLWNTDVESAPDTMYLTKSLHRELLDLGGRPSLLSDHFAQILLSVLTTGRL
jgi:hypothetical protein